MTCVIRLIYDMYACSTLFTLLMTLEVALLCMLYNTSNGKGRVVVVHLRPTNEDPGSRFKTSQFWRQTERKKTHFILHES